MGRSGHSTSLVVPIVEFLVATATLADEFMQTIPRDEFVSDEKAQRVAMSYNHDLGEGLAYLRHHSEELFDLVTDGPRIIGSRNFMSHKIFERDMEILYDSLVSGIPVLLREVEDMLREVRK